MRQYANEMSGEGLDIDGDVITQQQRQQQRQLGCCPKRLTQRDPEIGNKVMALMTGIK